MMISTTTATCVASRMYQIRTGSRISVSKRAWRAAVVGSAGRATLGAGASVTAAAGAGNAACERHGKNARSIGDRTAIVGIATAEIRAARGASLRWR